VARFVLFWVFLIKLLAKKGGALWAMEAKF
jgi:hypothetical protein